MFMQIFRQLLCCQLAILLLAGCHKAATDPFAESGKDAERIDCAIAGASDYTRVCTIDRVAGPDGLILTIRHPDGGFRRLKVTTDGHGVVAADGSAAATVAVAGDRQIEVTVGKDRYRLPATVKRQGT